MATCFIVATPGNNGAKGVAKRPAGEKKHHCKYRRRQHNQKPYHIPNGSLLRGTKGPS
jgi:hypothetical protein